MTIEEAIEDVRSGSCERCGVHGEFVVWREGRDVVARVMNVCGEAQRG
jgi:hypothetical protein